MAGAMDTTIPLNSSNRTIQPLPSPSIDPRLYGLIVSVMTCLGLCLTLFAIAGNILTIIVYFRLGFTESTNISLVTLAISDLIISCFKGSGDLIFLLPFIGEFLIPSEVIFTTIACPHLVLSRFSALITSFLSLERYLCVLLPLKIKRIITPRRTVMVMCLIFMISVPPVTIAYFRYPLGMRYVPELNKTLLGILVHSDDTINGIYLVWQVYSANILPLATFVTVVTCTALLGLSLNRSKLWRDSNRKIATTPAPKSGQDSGAEQQEPKDNNKTNSKEAKAVRMVVAIATVFIVCTIPTCAHVVTSMTVPGFEVNGQHSDLFQFTGIARSLIDTINAGANVIIYYNMSTKFRLAFRELLCFLAPNKKNGGKHNRIN